VPPAANDLRDLLERIDAGMVSGTAGHDRGLAWPPATPSAGAGDPRAETPALEAPFVERTRMEGMLAELYDDFGAASFTAQWQYDQSGLLAAATRLLDDLRLIRRLPGGVLILPAAARYRNITAALPDSARHDGQDAFNFTSLPTEGPV
jgi:hypothetical protein